MAMRIGLDATGVLLYGGDMKVWMVLALLAMGLGCSQPEPWSHPRRQSFVEACTSAGQPGGGHSRPRNQKFAIESLQEGGYTVREICRVVLQEAEAQYTESDFLLLSDGERRFAIRAIVQKYSKEIGGNPPHFRYTLLWEWQYDPDHGADGFNDGGMVWVNNLGSG
jgi:hypothetical protein